MDTITSQFKARIDRNRRISRVIDKVGLTLIFAMLFGNFGATQAGNTDLSVFLTWSLYASFAVIIAWHVYCSVSLRKYIASYRQEKGIVKKK